MFPRSVSTVLRAAAAATIIAAAAVGAAGVAHAEPAMTATDMEFLQGLGNVGITFDNPAAGVTLAGSVCDAVDDGYSYEDVFDATMQKMHLSADQADTLIFNSVFYYCVDLLPYVA